MSEVKYRKGISKEFTDFIIASVKRQQGEFCVNDIAKMADGKFSSEFAYQHIRVYVSRIVKNLEREGAVVLVREDVQGRGGILKKMYKVAAKRVRKHDCKI
jgi:hypothetical protein